MRSFIIITLTLLSLGLLLSLSACEDEEPRFDVLNSTIDDTEYSGGGELFLLFSTDNGSTFSEVLPVDLKRGDMILVKVNNGTSDLTGEDYLFDWSASSLASMSSTDPVAEFIVSRDDISFAVKVSDRLQLVATHNTNGKVFAIDIGTGAQTEFFTPLLEGSALTGARGFVYHRNLKRYFVTRSGSLGGALYSVNATSKVATVINANNGGPSQWDAIASLAVHEDDSLVAAIGGTKREIAKFGATGGKSGRSKEITVCCGMGMIYEGNNTALIANNPESGGEVKLERVNFGAAGSQVLVGKFKTLNGFPVSLAASTLFTRALAQDTDGSIYALIFSSSNQTTYLAKIDLQLGFVDYVATLGVGSSNQYFGLTFIPKHLI